MMSGSETTDATVKTAVMQSLDGVIYLKRAAAAAVHEVVLKTVVSSDCAPELR